MLTRLQVAGKMLALFLRAPGWLLRASLGYRRWRTGFLAAAAASGLPREEALGIAREMRPAALLHRRRPGRR